MWWEQSKRTMDFSIKRSSLIWKLFPSFMNANVWKYTTFSEKKKNCSDISQMSWADYWQTDFLQGSTSVNCTVSFWVLQSGKIRASFICDHSGRFWNKWIFSISTPKQQSFTTLKWQLLWSYSGIWLIITVRFLKNNTSRGWGDCLVPKSLCCYCRESEFISQEPQESAHNCLLLQLHEASEFSCTHTYVHIHTERQNHEATNSSIQLMMPMQ